MLLGREMDTRTTVYKKTDEIYQLKMKASVAFFSEVEKKFGNMPFTLRALEDEKKARMGVVECVNHKLIEPFTVLYEKEGELVAQFKFTVLLMPSGSHKITGEAVDWDMYETEHDIKDDTIKVNFSATFIYNYGRVSFNKKTSPSLTTVLNFCVAAKFVLC
ncbi:proliferation-associated protein 2G4-like isoform X2 [Tachypleus tridentatus]|uniref:proliferation-associated protein 2G4-like isoform X2 n=1 Tax=Tachypleus tridentatus TaxID=6853 RepID=UPI003FD66717